MTAFEKDRFDAIPDTYPRVGVHRARPSRLRGAAPVLWSLLATVALVAIGIAGVEAFSARFSGSSGGGSESAGGGSVEAPVAEVPAQAVFSADETITVLNGSTSSGLASTVGERLSGAGWTVGTAANAVQDDVATTTVYYADPLDEGAARGVALSLGIGAVERSDAFPGSSLTVVIGNDYSA